MDEHSGVLIVAEVANDRLASVTLELLGLGRRLADGLGEGLGAVLFDGQDTLAQELIAYGVDQVYGPQSPLAVSYQGDVYSVALERICREVSPDILLLGQTSLGRDLAPRVAFRLGVGLTMDCLELAIDPETGFLQQTKPVYGGNIRAVYMSESKPQMATVRVKAMEPAVRQEGRTGQVVAVDVAIDAGQVRTRTLQRVEEKPEGVRLEEAKVVVSGGGGLGSAENFRYIQDLAQVLGGAAGATRRIIDYGWVDPNIQVGLTGKVVTPELYVAVALSGSPQHLAGCASSRTMVAFNRDPDAPIFRVARYGVVGDFKESLPAFTKKIKELLAQ